MGTGYDITLGYLSGDSWSRGEDAAWDTLVEIVEQLRREPERIATEARRLGAPEECQDGCGTTLMDYCRAYQGRDATITINRKERYILQLATGDRALKEAVRRAFCRLVIEDAHRLGIEVNLKVA